MKRLLISVCLLLFNVITLLAQINVRGINITDMKGKPLMNNSVSEVQGSVYYKEEYFNAKLYLIDGQEITDIKIKLNLRDNIVNYVNNEGAEMEAVSKIKRILFTETGDIFESGFPAVNKQDNQTFYRVIISGKASLLLFTNFVESDFKAFNSAITTKQIDKVIEIFGVSPNAISLLTQSEDVLQLLKDKNKEVYNYIITNHLKCKKQSDFEKIIKYYNTLIN